ncbi:MAG: hypothetical protein LN590_07770 [Rickettsia endosymbiont of Glossina mortisans submortisans]|nr:hypothetical protein [Rickettsia endosymbiont of Glossina mortisans submortisans]
MNFILAVLILKFALGVKIYVPIPFPSPIFILAIVDEVILLSVNVEPPCRFNAADPPTFKPACALTIPFMFIAFKLLVAPMVLLPANIKLPLVPSNVTLPPLAPVVYLLNLRSWQNG